jgi:hypothetical protein
VESDQRPIPIVDQNCLADRQYRQHHSHGETTAQFLEAGANLRSATNGSVASSDHWESGTTIPIDDPSRLADLLFRYHHSHEETTAHPLYPYEPMRDQQYHHHHSHGESSTEASLIPSNHMKFVWKLIEWENGEEATSNSLSTHAANNLAAIEEVIAKDLGIDCIIPRSYIEKKSRHILQPLLSIKNNWLSSMSMSLL